jgi:prolyl-tRNA editing enzyme YbaK/EbsC (Cys-tRNA(Pro) deacylase)
MAIPKKILKYLDSAKTGYKIVRHKTVYTAYDAAQTLGVKLNEIAKTLVVKADKLYLIVVLSASHRLDLGKLKKIAKVKKIEIAKENVMQKIFKVKPGAVTPFGALYKTPVFVDRALLRSKKIIAGAGTHEDSVVMTAKNFLKATGGTVGDFSKKK